MSKGRRKKGKRMRTSSRVGRLLPDDRPAQRRPRDEQLLAALNAAADLYLDRTGLTLSLTDGTESLIFVRAKDPVVYVFADEAATHRGAKRIPGDFRKPGTHWGELRQMLLAAQGGGDTPIELPEMHRVLAALPTDGPDQFGSAALRASARLRTARTRAFSRAAVLEAELYILRFEPVYARSQVVLPFTYRENDGPEIVGALELESTSDPITMLVVGTPDEATVLRAWAAGLLGYAELTCIPEPSVTERGRNRGRGDRSGDPGAAKQKRGSVPRRPSRGRQRVTFSHALTPVGSTATYAASHVAGHRRQLKPGHRCSDDQRLAARTHGIALSTGETWVRPHERGVPRDFVLRFAWPDAPKLA